MLVLSGCDKSSNAVPTLLEPVAAEYETAVVERDDLYELVTYDAKVYPHLYEAHFTISGKIKEVNYYLGDKVKKGEIIYSMDYKSATEKLEEEESSLQDMIERYDYEALLYEYDHQMARLNIEKKLRDGASDMEIARLEAELEKLIIRQTHNVETQQYNIKLKNQKIDELKSAIENYHLRAPADGTIVYLNFGKKVHRYGYIEEDNINAHDTVVIIASDEQHYLQTKYINASTLRKASEYYALINGKEYEIEYKPLDSFEAQKIKDAPGTIESRFYFDKDDNVAVGDYACILIKEKAVNDVIVVPKKSIFREASGAFVYRLEGDSLVRVDVEIGAETSIQVEIKSGLQEGDIIYVKG